MTISERLDEIEARANAATDGPWAARHRAGLDWLSQSPHVDNDGHEPGSSVGLADAVDPLWGSLWPSRNATADAEFIAHARTDVPALVAALRAVLDVCEKSELGAYPEPTYDEYIPGQLDTAERVREAIAAALNH
jgi:hypothetical protein